MHKKEGGSIEAHRQGGPKVVGCFVLSCSDTRGEAEDASGAHMQQLLQENGHRVCGYALVPDEPTRIREVLQGALSDEAVQVVLTTGGTGLGRRDATVQVLEALIEKPLPGFGELFRMLSFEEIGSAAMLSRALAGSIGRKCIFGLPGSKAAVDLALRRLILPELSHIMRELS